MVVWLLMVLVVRPGMVVLMVMVLAERQSDGAGVMVVLGRG